MQAPAVYFYEPRNDVGAFVFLRADNDWEGIQEAISWPVHSNPRLVGEIGLSILPESAAWRA